MCNVRPFSPTKTPTYFFFVKNPEWTLFVASTLTLEKILFLLLLFLTLVDLAGSPFV